MKIIFETQAENPKCIKLNFTVVNIVTKEIVAFFFIKLIINYCTKYFRWKYKVKYIYFKFIYLCNIFPIYWIIHEFIVAYIPCNFCRLFIFFFWSLICQRIDCINNLVQEEMSRTSENEISLFFKYGHTHGNVCEI